MLFLTGDLNRQCTVVGVEPEKETNFVGAGSSQTLCIA